MSEPTTDSFQPIRSRKGIRKGVYILPNLFTTASLFCGFYSILHSITGDFLQAAWAIFFSGIFDAMDGRLARLMKAQTDFGLEYDSLVDAASFGLAPAILAFTWSLHFLGRFGWATSFLYFACGVLRLARFNVQSVNVEKRFFQGLPIPIAAYGLAGFVIFTSRFQWDPQIASYFLMALMISLSFLMVSSVRYYNFKHLDFSRPQSFIFLVFAAVVLFIVASAPQETLFFASLAYILMGPVEKIIRIFNRNKILERKLSERDTQDPVQKRKDFKLLLGSDRDRNQSKS